MAKKKQKKASGGQQFLSDEQFIRQRIRQLPTDKCYITDVFEESGTNHIIVTRRHTGGRLSIGVFMVDRLCLGVKDSFYRLRIEDYQMDDILHGPEGITFRECSYEEAHNRIYGAIAFAEEGGIKPHKSFALTKYFLEEDTDDVPLIEYEFGENGHHVLVCDSLAEASQYAPILRKHLGVDGFKYLIGRTGTAYDDEDDGHIHLMMADLVAEMEKNNLTGFSIMLGFDVDKEQTIEEMRRHYIEQVMSNPMRILGNLPENDVHILKKIRDKPSLLYDGVPVPFNYSYTILERLGLAEGDWDELGYYHIYVAEDFAAPVMPLLDNVDDDGFSAKFVVETIFEGMANLYGEVSLAEVKQVLKDVFKLDDKGAEKIYDMTLCASLLMGVMVTSFDGVDALDETTPEDKIYFVSSYHWNDVDAQHREIQSRSAGLQPRHFTAFEILAAATCPLPAAPNKVQKRFEAFLKSNLPYSDDDLKEISFNIWYRAQHERDSTFQENSAEDYFLTEVIGKEKYLLSRKLQAEAQAILKEYLANMPRWTLKGHSPEHGES